MTRSLRVRPDFIDRVRFSLRRNGFPTQRALAEDLGLSLDTVGKFVRGKPVDRAIFEELCDRLSLNRQEIATFNGDLSGKSISIAYSLNGAANSSLSDSVSNSPIHTATDSDLSLEHQDWGDAPKIETFHGRIQELATLQQWLNQEQCRLVAILGMGGMGKTTLVLRLANLVINGEQKVFKHVIWRSLLNAPPIEEILTDLIQFVSNHQDVHLPDSLDGKIARLLQYLQQHRCLLILDNVESVFQGETQVGRYLPGYEGYGHLFQQIGEFQHQSCLILTSREKPREVALLEGDTLPVRSFYLRGISSTEGWEIFKAKGCYGIDDRALQNILDYYAGNPLALRIVASAVQELADGDMADLLPALQAGRFQFGDISDLLEQQFERLSAVEQQVMYWLGINRDPVSLADLEADVVSDPVKRQLLGAVQSLVRRCLVETNQKQILLQPVMTEYVTCRLVMQVCQEIVQHQRNFLRDYALLKAQSRDYVRHAQTCLILQPLLDELQVVLGSPRQVELHLKTMLNALREEAPLQPGYVGGNLLNLLHELQSDLTGLDCSDLTLWQAYLVGVPLHGVNFSGSDLSQSVFTDTLTAALAVQFSPEGTLFAAGSADGLVRVWSTSDGQKRLTCQGHTSWIWSVAFSPTQPILATCGFDQTAKLWNAQSHECERTLEEDCSWVWSIAFSHDGQHLASGSSDSTIRIWQPQTGELMQILAGHTNLIMSIAFHPDSTVLASGSVDRTIRLWNMTTGECSRVITRTGRVWSVSFSPNGQIIASGSEDRAIRLWNAQTGECLQELKGHRGLVFSAIFSPDGQMIASGSSDQTVKLWDLRSGQCRHTLLHQGRVWSVAFSPDGETLASSGEDCTVKLWDVRSGTCLRTLVGHQSEVWATAFSPFGEIVASGSQDGEIKLWRTATGEQVSSLRNKRPYENLNISHVTGLTDAQKESLKILGACDSTGIPSDNSLKLSFTTVFNKT